MHLVTMLVLTFSTGILDAVGYLGLDRVFTANMTGNVVILGMGLVGAAGLPVVGPLVALLAFVAGAFAGGVLGRGAREGWSARTTGSFAVSAAVVTASGIACLVVLPRAGTVWAYVVTALLAAAMGLQGAVARRLAVADVTTVVITSTIVGLASETLLHGAGRKNTPRRILAILLMLAGAAVGALLVRVHVGLGMLIAGGIALLAIGAGHLLRERLRS